MDFFYGLRMTQGYQLDHSLSQRLLKHLFDNFLLEHVNVGLICVLSWTRAFQYESIPAQEHQIGNEAERIVQEN